MLTAQNLSYIHPNKDLLFDNIDLTLNTQDKIALITVDCVNEPSVKEYVRQLLKLERVSDWTYTRSADGATQQIEARYTEITDMMALEIKRRLMMAGGVLNVDIIRDRIPPKNPRL